MRSSSSKILTYAKHQAYWFPQVRISKVLRGLRNFMTSACRNPQNNSCATSVWFCSVKPDPALFFPSSDRSLKLGYSVKWVPRRGGKQRCRDPKLAKSRSPPPQRVRSDATVILSRVVLSCLLSCPILPPSPPVLILRPSAGLCRV